MSSPAPPEIRPVAGENLVEALQQAFSGLSDEDRTARLESVLENLRRSGGSAEGVFEARRGGRMVGAIVSQVHPGRAAMVWPPRLVPGEPAETSLRLLDEALGLLATRRVLLVHAVLESPVDAADVELLRAAGFEFLAELHYLVAEESEFPRQAPAGDLKLDPVDSDQLDRLCRVVEATYRQSLDCPALNGVRPTGEVLAGYRMTGCFRPELWSIARRGGIDVGCLILADHPKHGNCELVYMGVAPECRGQGLGLTLAKWAQWTARRLDRRRLVLAVDSANRPAHDLYAAAGFRGWDRRQVFIKVLSSD